MTLNEQKMHPLLVFGGAFALSLLVAAVVCRFGAAKAASLSLEEKQRKQEAAARANENYRKTLQWISTGVLGVLVIVAVLSWFSSDPRTKQEGLLVAAVLALPFLALWGKTRDDGFYPQLRKPDQPAELKTPNDDGSPPTSGEER